MDAVILAAGRGDGLRPLTTELPEPMVPVLDRPLMAHTVDLLRRQDVGRIAANLHEFPERVRAYFGDELSYRVEREQLGTAGGVRGLFPLLSGGTFLVVSGDVLTDLDVGALIERHRAHGGVATVCVKRVPFARGFGVITADLDGRVVACSQAAMAGEAVVNCGIYVLEPEVFEHFPRGAPVDWARDVFPALLEHDVPFYVHEMSDYWMDVGSPRRLRQATFDLVAGRVDLPVAGTELDEGLVLGDGSSLDGVALVEPPVWIGADVQIGVNTHLEGPVVIGDGATVGDGAQLRETIVWPESSIPRETMLIGAIAGHARVVEAYTPRGSA
jgi:mannose-1-phosphate guanylyltransferase/mannose-1-phosphate guanylyltransferase/phosphomannomutase